MKWGSSVRISPGRLQKKGTASADGTNIAGGGKR